MLKYKICGGIGEEELIRATGGHTESPLKEAGI
jgi:hypothetical protein